MRVALVYDRLNKIGGAEQVLLAFHDLYPDADWYTSVYQPSLTPFTHGWKITTSWLNKIPFLRTHHEWIPYLMPFVFESFNFNNYDLVISIGSAESKGVITKPGTYHLNYCLTPTRYLHSHHREYLSNFIYRFIAKFLREWDLIASTRPDEMIAISTQVKKRIKDVYDRDSVIIFPPVNTKKFLPTGILEHRNTGVPNDYFLVVSRLVPYKKIDVLVKAANQSGKNLIIIGEGSEYSRLARLAGPTVTLLGHVEDDQLPRYYQHCLAYLQANEEDFGISMCEAQSAGKPVIAYAQGGAQDIVIPDKTGILLSDNSVATFAKALLEFDTMTFLPSVCINNAARFAQNIWTDQIKERINHLCQPSQK